MRWRLRAWGIGMLVALAAGCLSCGEGASTACGQSDGGAPGEPSTERRPLACSLVGGRLYCVYLLVAAPKP